MTEFNYNTVDVVIPAYNAAAYIRNTLCSVALQTIPVHSVIVVNDGSSDNTLEVIEAFVRDYPAVCVKVVSQTNGGHSNARNNGIRAATAEYVALLDSDDIWHPTKIARQLEVFAQANDPSLGVVYCDYALIDEKGEALNQPRYVLNRTVRGDVREYLYKENCIAGSASAVLIRRSLFEKAGLFDESLLSAEDWDMWIRLSEIAKFDYAPDQLVDIRRRSSSEQTNINKVLDGELVLLGKLLQKGVANDSHIRRLRHLVALSHVNVTALECWDFLDKRLQKMFSGWRFSLWAKMFLSNRRIIVYIKKIVRFS